MSNPVQCLVGRKGSVQKCDVIEQQLGAPTTPLLQTRRAAACQPEGLPYVGQGAAQVLHLKPSDGHVLIDLGAQTPEAAGELEASKAMASLAVGEHLRAQLAPSMRIAIGAAGRLSAILFAARKRKLAQRRSRPVRSLIQVFPIPSAGTPHHNHPD
jgi:hypothetical protein